MRTLLLVLGCNKQAMTINRLTVVCLPVWSRANVAGDSFSNRATNPQEM
jgi:hypothetical protein